MFIKGFKKVAWDIQTPKPPVPRPPTAGQAADMSKVFGNTSVGKTGWANVKAQLGFGG